ncbi:hypothetical protein [Algiphilus sp.]|uniref:hypothetical protein n=1 Tax=Algiphilus sp. TaxID=1872431 RepID=UPI003B519757
MSISFGTASLLHTVSSYILILGVILTAIGTIGQLWMGYIKEDYRQTEIAEARTAAQESGERAQNAEEEVQRIQAPRRLDSEVRGEVLEQLSAFSGQEFTAVIAPSGFDVRPLWIALDKLLREAGWSRAKPAGLASGDPPAGIAIESQPGVQVVIDRQHYEIVGEAALVLVDALNKLGVEAAPGFGRDHKEKRDNIITLRIGPKPQ